jgi:hypothetical protein
MITKKNIKTETARYKSFQRNMVMFERQCQYKKLISKFGMDNVAAASGLNKTTLAQYLGTASPSIGYDALTMAQVILGRLHSGE